MQGLHWRLVLVLRHVVRQQCFWVESKKAPKMLAVQERKAQKGKAA